MRLDDLDPSSNVSDQGSGGMGFGGGLRGSRRLAVGERTAPSLGLHDATHDELAIERHAHGLELRGDPRAVLHFEHGGDLGLARARTHGVRTRPTAEDERERVDDHRLSGAGLAGQDVEARPQLERLPPDQDDVPGCDPVKPFGEKKT